MIESVLNICKHLLFKQPFWGAILIGLQKEVTTRTKTACVGLNGVMYKLKINPDFWNSLSDKHQQGLLIHELGHIVNFHLTEYNHLKNDYVANVAMDIYINQTIPDDLLPPGAMMYDKFGLPKGKDTNWYYNELIKELDDKNSAMSKVASAMENGDDSIDIDGNTILLPDHDWGEIKDAPESIQKMVSKNAQVMLKNIIQQSSAPGSIPGGLEELLERLSIIEPPKFNWRGFVRTFIGVSTKTWSNKTNRKKSKRFIGQPGLREKTYSKILVAFDSSYSVSSYDLNEFQKELHHIHKTGHEIDIIVADTKIRQQFKFNPRIPIEIKGRGGTDFQEVIDLYRKNLNKYSCLIYLTDGEAYPPQNARGNILWVHGTNHEINEDLPGKKIKLN